MNENSFRMLTIKINKCNFNKISNFKSITLQNKELYLFKSMKILPRNFLPSVIFEESKKLLF